MEIFALFMFLGIFTSLLIPETKRRTLEQLAGEVPGTANFDPSGFTGGMSHHMAPKVSNEGSAENEYREAAVERKN